MIKQYVNLPANQKNHQGRGVSLVATAADLGPDKIRLSEWWIEPAAGNTDLKYLSTPDRCRLAKKFVRNQDKKFKNKVVLPYVGGDKYKILCSKKGDRSKAKQVEEIETWRKIFYTVHWMNAACLNLFNAVKGSFEGAFAPSEIELEKVADLQTLIDEPRSLSRPVDLSYLHKKKPKLKSKPFHLRIVVVNDIYDIKTQKYGSAHLGAAAFPHVCNSGPLSDHPKYPWLQSAMARIEPNGKWVSIRKCVTKTSDTSFTVDLAPNAKVSKALTAGKTIQIRIQAREREHYCGHSIGNFIVVRKNEANPNVTVLQTFTHEVGHGFQQVVRREKLYKPNGARDGSKWDTNANWHTDDYGGQGPHCHYNAVTAADPDTSSGMTYVHDPTLRTLCTMFFRDDRAVDANGKFCVSCQPRLARVNLGQSKMKQAHWSDY